MTDELAITSGVLARRVTWHDLSLDIDPDTTYEEWVEIMVLLGRIHDASAWWVADGVLHGEKAYGEMYAQAIEDTGLKRSTLQNYVSVASRFPPSQRRGALKFAHHADVAYLDPDERERWLDAAEANDWTRQEMRQHIQAEKNGTPIDECDHQYVCAHCGEVL